MRLLVRLALAGAAVALTIALLRRRSSRGARVGYVSLVAQGLHYWSRPHAGVVPTAPITSRAAWIGAELAQQPELWRHEVTPAEAAALHRAVAAAEATGKAMGMLSAADFPVGAEWLARIAALRRELMHGLGFFVLRGLPVGEWSTAQQELAYWGLGLHLGLPGAQNNEGDLLGHVRDIGGDASTERQYKTRAEVLFHCDAADAVGLLMVQAAKDGGTSRLVSSASVFNRLLRDAPDVAPRLFRPLPMDTRGGGGVDWVRIEPLRVDTAGTLRTFYHTGYFRSVERFPSARPFMDSAALDAYDATASDPELHLDMELQPGDLQLVSNHFILHARTAYEDYEEPGRKRHLLRLWLSFDDPSIIWRDRLSKFGHLLTFTCRMVNHKVRNSLGL